jgi:hypothetical protein
VKKYFVLAMFITVAVMVIALFAGCSDNRVSEEVNNIDSEEMTVIEQWVFDNLIIGLLDGGFHNPASVRILEIGGFYNIPSEMVIDGRAVLLRIQGENRMGGTTSDFYRLVTRVYSYRIGRGADIPVADWDRLVFVEEGDIAIVDELYIENIGEDNIMKPDDFSVRRINNAIREYFDNLGIN